MRKAKIMEKRAQTAADAETNVPGPEISPGILIQPMSALRRESQAWLWRGVIPSAALTLLAGDPHSGKSLLSIDWAARVSTGRRWPDGKANRGGSVIMVAPEDRAGTTLHDRLTAAGADLDRVHIVSEIEGATSAFSLASDLPLLQSYASRLGDVRLVIVDPISAALPGVNLSGDNAIRTALRPLLNFAARHRIAVVAVMHFNKSAGRKAIYRFSGSIGLPGVARAAWIVAPQPHGQSGVKLLLPAKLNIAKTPPGISFRVIASPKLRSAGAIEYQNFNIAAAADEALAEQRRPAESAQSRARNAIREIFRNRRIITSRQLAVTLSKAGISKRTFERVKASEGIRSFKRGAIWAYQMDAA
ncbi:MAG TPA: AAA family ATPase [Tepidisphaeraceae bacterium]|nr:AAA family ATPase [Tepidisphaeraceae bacterium]